VTEARQKAQTAWRRHHNNLRQAGIDVKSLSEEYEEGFITGWVYSKKEHQTQTEDQKTAAIHVTGHIVKGLIENRNSRGIAASPSDVQRWIRDTIKVFLE
jgi:hypothetical protein